MKKIWVGTSWKMNKTSAEATAFAEQLNLAISNTIEPGGTELVQPFVCPPFPYLSSVCDILNESPVRVGGQNMAWENAGAFTGEVSAPMLVDCGASLVELGHSERREMFGETDITVNRKVHQAFRHDLTPLICVGDNLDEKNAGASTESVVRQVKMALNDLTCEECRSLLIAYEPIWAIGTNGIPATPEEANTVHHAIKEALVLQVDGLHRDEITILYGGSVNQENARSLLSQPDIDGLFIGRAAWDISGYLTILQTALDYQNSR